MLFSGKITNSFLIFLDRSGIDLDKLFELSEVPTEFLRDPTCWIPAQEVESFLHAIDKDFGANFPESIATLTGHQCHDLRAWGVLDSVIRMMSKPQDIYLQPHRFISYFVLPAPPLAHIVREEETISFDIPISNQEFPMVTEFLRSALEILPKYLGRESALVRWKQNRLKISWSESQGQFLADEDLGPNFKPELVQNLMQALEDSQRQIEQLTDQLNQQKGGAPASAPATELDPELQQSLRSCVVKVRGHMMKLSDYLVRSQQLVTLLIGQNRLDRQVQEAMRRVDWEYVKSQSSPVAQEIVNLLQEFEEEITARTKASHIKKSRVELQRTLDLQN